MKKITVGIIGAGRIGKVHAMSIANQVPNARIKWIADYKEDVIGDWIYQYGIENKTGNHMDILNDPAVDAMPLRQASIFSVKSQFRTMSIKLKQRSMP